MKTAKNGMPYRYMTIPAFLLLIVCACLMSCQTGNAPIADSDVTNQNRLEKRIKGRKAVKPAYNEYSESLKFLMADLPTSKHKKLFIEYIIPRTKTVLKETVVKRDRLLQLEKKKNLSNQDSKWLDQLSKDYRVFTNKNGNYDWVELKKRVDVLPMSLILAQAALESSWGKSDFAQAGNNLFGKQCYTKGCGIVPKRRPEGKTYEVAKYKTVKESIRKYLLNLNRHKAYKQLRNMRHKARENGEPLRGILLAESLLKYSEEGSLYPKKIKRVILSNKFTLLDE